MNLNFMNLNFMNLILIVNLSYLICLSINLLYLNLSEIYYITYLVFDSNAYFRSLFIKLSSKFYLNEL